MEVFGCVGHKSTEFHRKGASLSFPRTLVKFFLDIYLSPHKRNTFAILPLTGRGLVDLHTNRIPLFLLLTPSIPLVRSGCPFLLVVLMIASEDQVLRKTLSYNVDISSVSALGCLLRAYFPRPALLSIFGNVRVFRCRGPLPSEGELILNVDKLTKEESIVAKYKPKHHPKVNEGSGKSFLLQAVNVSELTNSGYSCQSMDWHFFHSDCAPQVLTGQVEVGLSNLRLTTSDCFHRRVCHPDLDHPLQTEARIVRELVLVCKKPDLTEQVCKKRSSTRKSWERSLVIARGAFLSIDRIPVFLSFDRYPVNPLHSYG
ncbi:hypothetical protein M9H77_06347 [Catharanthus roseus]|uniref:Uncharacterized protein n=1 Tax=Catharanthus roseus TaxID=4058 RepID=A0ACC0BRU6_CATRO|nr:hypothetical protein M9H77_06347 [Catharanthus roseus]